MSESHRPLGKYVIVRELGSGGFANVFLATDTVLHREVALKVLRPVLMDDANFVRSFQVDARAAARLQHPNIITIHDLGLVEGRLFIDMKYMAGGSLADRIEMEGAVPLSRALPVLQQVAGALDFAHEQGLVHRDVKPANVLFDAAGQAVLSDFGMVKAAEESVLVTTVMGGAVGTPQYMAPEIWDEKEVTAATDVYALGCLLFDMLMGKALFEGTTAYSIMRAHFLPRRFPEQWPDGVPDQVQEVLARAVHQEPTERFQRAGDLTRALEALVAPPPPPPPPPDPLAQTYTALKEAIAVQDWREALRLAQEIMAQDDDYRDVSQLAETARNKMSVVKPSRNPRPILILGAGVLLVMLSVLGLVNMNEQANERARSTTIASYSTSSRETALAFETGTAQAGATATAQAGATATAQAGATATAQAGATATARAQVNATARAQVNATAQAQATATVRPTNTVTDEIIDYLNSGPIPLREAMSGELEHVEDGFVDVVDLEVTVRDFIVEVTFGNPSSTAVSSWDYGLNFRSTGPNEHYRLILTSDGEMWLSLREGGGPSINIVRLDIPAAARFVSHATGENQLVLAVRGGQGYIYINGQFITALDLSDRMVSGSILAGTGYFDGHEIAGEVTTFSNLTLWEWDS